MPNKKLSNQTKPLLHPIAMHSSLNNAHSHKTMIPSLFQLHPITCKGIISTLDSI